MVQINRQLNGSTQELVDFNYAVLIGSLHHKVAVLVLDEKQLVSIFDAHFFSKQNETSFIRDLYCHLADDGSPLSMVYSVT